MLPRFFVPVILPLLLLNYGLFAQNLLINGSLERPDGVNPVYDELPPGSTAIPGWTVGVEGGIDGIRFYWPASAGRDSVDLTHGVLGPGSIFQDVLLTKGKRYRLSFDMAYNPDLDLPVAVEVSIGSVSNVFTRSAGSSSPFWQRQSFVFSAKKTGIARLTFAEKRTSETGANETALDNIVLETEPRHEATRARVYILDRDNRYTVPTDVSSDGRVVVGGRDDFQTGAHEPFRWVRGTGIRRIDVPFGEYSYALGVSSNGAVIVGAIVDGESLYDRVFRWTKRTGAVELITNVNLSLVAGGVSGDGSVIFGSYAPVTNRYLFLPFRWTVEAGFQPLNTLGGAVGGETLGETGATALVTDATHDGGLLVGSSQTANQMSRACRWRSSSMNPEPLDPSEEGHSHATATTPGLSTIVGSWWETPETQRMCRWSSARSSRELLDTNTTYTATLATDVSADGQRILGAGRHSPDDFVAVLWTPEDGIRSLDERFPGLLPEGWAFADALAISSNGRWIVGLANKPAWGVVGYILDTGRLPRRE